MTLPTQAVLTFSLSYCVINEVGKEVAANTMKPYKTVGLN
jgi:hypothetical protein